MPAQLIYFLLLIAIAVIQKPSMILRPQWLSRLSAKEGIHWSGLTIQSRSAGFLKPEIKFSWSALHVGRPGLEVSSGPGKITLALDFRRIPPTISRIDKMRAASVDIWVSPSNSSKSTTNTETRGVAIPNWLRGTQIGAIQLDVSSWRLPGERGRAYLSHFQSSVLMSDAQWRWEAWVTESAHHASASISGGSINHSLYGPWELQLDARASKIAPRIAKARIRNCKIRLFGSTRLLLSCPLEISGRLPRIREVPRLHFSDRIEATLQAELSSRDFLDMNQRVRMDSRLQLRPVFPLGEEHKMASLTGGLHIAGSFVPSDPVEKWQLKSNLNLALKIEKFHRLVRFLSSTKYAIPAPLNALNGSLLLEATGELSLNHAKIPLVLQSRLHSKNQDLDLKATGTLEVPRLKPLLQPHLELALTLVNVRIPLPHLELGSVPQLVPDARMTAKVPVQRQSHQSAGRAPPASSFSYHVSIQTAKEPIRIQTNLAKSPIPIQLKLSLNSGEKPTGIVNVDSFPLDLFRRNAVVQSVRVELTPKTQNLSGAIRIDYADYIIYVKLFGTIDQPEYALTSNPPLSDSDVVSVLLFGQTSEDLDPSQTQSVGSVRSAVAARSLDLASMYLLASTPVESVGYDPESGVVSMRLRLASGTSLEVAQGQQELQSVGIRHRIGSHWSITTAVGNPADPTNKSISALFQWSHRY